MKLTSCEGNFILSQGITAVNTDMKKTSLFIIPYPVFAGGGAVGAFRPVPHGYVIPGLLSSLGWTVSFPALRSAGTAQTAKPD